MGRVTDFLNAKLGSETPQRVGIAGFTMLARVRETYSYESEVPTTFLEDGSSVEDHIILKATRLSIEGEVADLFITPSVLQAFTSEAATTIGSVTAYLPERTASQRQVINSVTATIGDAVSAADDVIRAGGNVASLFGSANSEGKPTIERFVDTMESLHLGRQVVAIEMPYRTFTGMRITKCDIGRDNQKKAIDFKVEAVEVRTADEVLSEISSLLGNPSPGLSGQAQGLTDKGVQEGAAADSSLLGTILGFGG